MIELTFIKLFISQVKTSFFLFLAIIYILFFAVCQITQQTEATFNDKQQVTITLSVANNFEEE
ncbi:MAG TPA: hypothetical protein VK136_05020 [Bacillota bacterium]|nr:hypothetical protein [Bacillota bacterium]